ncbi:DNA topoisomerase 4 subunit A, partial [Haemophilus influenzae]
LLARMKPLH